MEFMGNLKIDFVLASHHARGIDRASVISVDITASLKVIKKTLKSIFKFISYAVTDDQWNSHAHS